MENDVLGFIGRIVFNRAGNSNLVLSKNGEDVVGQELVSLKYFNRIDSIN